MSHPKVKEMRNLSAQELEQKKNALQKDLHTLRQKKITGQLEKPHEFKATRRQVAQINTIMREKKNV